MIGILERSKDMAGGIREFRLRIDEAFSYLPGQYIMLSFQDNPDDKRAFSVVDFDFEKKEVSLLVKKEGAFTGRLFNERLGAEINVFGPYGRFTLPEKPAHLVFIGGGIGITPLYSMIKHAYHSSYGRKIYLFYSAKFQGMMALHDELDSMKSDRIIIEFNFTGSGKRLGIDDIRKVPEFDSSMFYICGPTKMIDGMRQGLIDAGISGEMMKSEEFQ